MATNASDTIAVGTSLPLFNLPDVFTGKFWDVEEVKKNFSKGVLVIFLCRHCPYVKHLEKELLQMAATFMPQGIGFFGISANDAVEYPEDAPESLREMVLEQKISFPILFDETQEVARAFTACCTPDFFLFNSHFELAYHGRFDGSTPKNGIPVTGADLRAALEQTCRGEAIAEPVALSLGCSIKWKKEA